MVVSFQQYAENRDFFSNFSADGLHNWSILLVIPLEFQERKHQPFLMTQPLFFEIPNKTKSLLWNVIVSSPQYGEKTAFFLQFFRWRTLRLRYFIGYPFGTSRNAASSISYDTAQKMERLSHIFSKEKGSYNCWVMQNANHVLRQGSLKGLRWGKAFHTALPLKNPFLKSP